MNNIFSKLKLIFLQAAAFLPTRLPTGMDEFKDWSNSIIFLYAKDIGTTSFDDIRFGLAGAIMHMGATESRKPKRFFGKLLHKGASSQIAYAIMMDLKAQQEAKVKEAQKAAAATPVTCAQE